VFAACVSNHICLPDVRLIGEVIHYQVVTDAYSGIPFYPTGMIAFNIGNSRIRLGAEEFISPCLFCIAVDPALITVDKDEGEVVMIRMRAGAFYRLFGLNGVEHGGKVIAANPDRYPILFGILNALNQASNSLAGRVAVLDKWLIPAAERAKPPGLGEKFRFVANWTKGNICVGEAAEKLGVSVRTLERECRRRFALTPKRILRGLRIFHAIAPANSYDGPVRWDSLDPTAQYSDQSHFLREHRKLSGLSPTELHRFSDRRDDQLIFHSRAGHQKSGETIAAEYEKNDRYSHFGPQIVSELGLEDWELY